MSVPKSARTIARRSAVRVRAVRVGAVLVGAVVLAATSVSAQSPDLALIDMIFVSSEGDATELVLRAERARVQPDAEIAHLEGVHATIGSEDDGSRFDVRCERGTLNLANNDFRAEGNVRGISEDGREFRTEWVQYEHEIGRLSTEAPVVMTEHGGSISGGGFEYLVKEDRFRLKGGATVVRE